MAHILDIQTIVDSERNVVLKVFIASDGASPEFTDIVILDASILVPVPVTLHITSITSDVTGFQSDLEWDSTTDEPLVHLAKGKQQYFWKKFGGIPDPKKAGTTGDITISTIGLTTLGSNGVIIIEATKQ